MLPVVTALVVVVVVVLVLVLVILDFVVVVAFVVLVIAVVDRLLAHTPAAGLALVQAVVVHRHFQLFANEEEHLRAKLNFCVVLLIFKSLFPKRRRERDEALCGSGQR